MSLGFSGFVYWFYDLLSPAALPLFFSSMDLFLRRKCWNNKPLILPFRSQTDVTSLVSLIHDICRVVTFTMMTKSYVHRIMRMLVFWLIPYKLLFYNETVFCQQAPNFKHKKGMTQAHWVNKAGALLFSLVTMWSFPQVTEMADGWNNRRNSGNEIKDAQRQRRLRQRKIRTEVWWDSRSDWDGNSATGLINCDWPVVWGWLGWEVRTNPGINTRNALMQNSKHNPPAHWCDGLVA